MEINKNFEILSMSYDLAGGRLKFIFSTTGGVILERECVGLNTSDEVTSEVKNIIEKYFCTEKQEDKA